MNSNDGEQRTSGVLRLLKKSSNLAEFMGSVHFMAPLHEYLSSLCEEKKKTIREISFGGRLDQWHVYQIFNGTKKKPARDLVIRIALGMQLTIEETQKLLRVAKHGELYPKELRDGIILFGMEHGKGFDAIEDDLIQHDLPCLRSVKEQKAIAEDRQPDSEAVKEE